MSKRKSTELSDLHDEVIQSIFSFLPPDDLVRTSILSTQFRHCWRRTSVLKLGENFCESFINSHTYDQFCDMLEHMFARIDAQLHEFELLIPLPPENIARVINFPPHVLSQSHLTMLKLRVNVLNLPPIYMGGFSKLKSLTMIAVRVDAILMEHLISQSPMLKEVIIISSRTVDDTPLRIASNSFEKLVIGCWMHVLILRNLPCLTSVFISAELEFDDGELGISPFQKFFRAMPNVKNLALASNTLFSLIERQVPENAQHRPFADVGFDERLLVYLALPLIRSVLNLNSLSLGFEEGNLISDPEYDAEHVFPIRGESALVREIEVAYSARLNMGWYNEIVLAIRKIVRESIKFRSVRQQ